MREAADVLVTLARLGCDPTSGAYVRPPADDDAISAMQAVARRDLGEPVPDEYVAFLRVANGAQINGAYFHSAEEVVPLNLDVTRPVIIVLGIESLAEFVFDRRDRRFHTINKGFPEERFDSFGSFAELLLNVLKEQQVLRD